MLQLSNTNGYLHPNFVSKLKNIRTRGGVRGGPLASFYQFHAVFRLYQHRQRQLSVKTLCSSYTADGVCVSLSGGAEYRALTSHQR